MYIYRMDACLHSDLVSEKSEEDMLMKKYRAIEIQKSLHHQFTLVAHTFCCDCLCTFVLWCLTHNNIL